MCDVLCVMLCVYVCDVLCYVCMCVCVYVCDVCVCVCVCVRERTWIREDEQSDHAVFLRELYLQPTEHLSVARDADLACIHTHIT